MAEVVTAGGGGNTVPNPAFLARMEKAKLNASGIKPVEFNVVVRADKVENISKGGVYIPDMAKDRQQAAAIQGEIIAVSPLAFTYEAWPDEMLKPKAGDRVFFAQWAGMKVKGKDGEEYLILKDKDIAAVIA